MLDGVTTSVVILFVFRACEHTLRDGSHGKYASEQYHWYGLVGGRLPADAWLLITGSPLIDIQNLPSIAGP